MSDGFVIGVLAFAATIAVLAGALWLEGKQPEPAPAPVCEPGVPVSGDGTCGLSWDDVRDSEWSTK